VRAGTRGECEGEEWVRHTPGERVGPSRCTLCVVAVLRPPVVPPARGIRALLRIAVHGLFWKGVGASERSMLRVTSETGGS